MTRWKSQKIFGCPEDAQLVLWVAEPFTVWVLTCDRVTSPEVERKMGTRNLEGCLQTSNNAYIPQDTARGCPCWAIAHTQRIHITECSLCSGKSQMAPWVNIHFTKKHKSSTESLYPKDRVPQGWHISVGLPRSLQLIYLFIIYFLAWQYIDKSTRKDWIWIVCKRWVLTLLVYSLI